MVQSEALRAVTTVTVRVFANESGALKSRDILELQVAATPSMETGTFCGNSPITEEE